MVDCGASRHLINDESRFLSFDKTFKASNHYVELSGGHQSNQLVTAGGTAQFSIDEHNTVQHIQLEDALLAPTIPTSLFSVHAATEKRAKGQREECTDDKPD